MELTVTKGEKPIEQWNCRDLLIYFAGRWKKVTGVEFLIPSPAWPGFMSRMKGFQNKTKLTNQEYAEFIDTVMSDLFARPGFTPNFGCIVSEKVLWCVRNKHEEHIDFEALRDELYRDSLLFSKLRERA